MASEKIIELDHKYSAHIYHQLPVVVEKASGVFMWSPENKKYYDFLSSYSCVNQGHCHKKIVQALKDQVDTLTLSSRAFFNNIYPNFAELVAKTFNYEKIIAMNSGAEGVETALKVAKRWGVVKKGINNSDVKVVVCENNFHGRTIGIVSMSSDDNSRENFGPILPGYIRIPFNDVNALKQVLAETPTVAAFLVEPIQGEAGVIVPDQGYLKACYEECKKYNVLFIADEIQTGMGRTGKMLACDWEDVKPDILILGKALSGGIMPISCVLSSAEIMEPMTVSSHGSTFGGNPLASAVGIASINVIKDEGLVENAYRQGVKLRNRLTHFQKNYPFITNVRGKGLLNAIVINPETSKSKTAWDLCLIMRDNGLLTKNTHQHIIRFCPPLVITDSQMDECISIIEKSLKIYDEL